MIARVESITSEMIDITQVFYTTAQLVAAVAVRTTTAAAPYLGKPLDSKAMP